MQLQANEQNHRLYFCLCLWCPNWRTDGICTELSGKISLDGSINSLTCANQLLLDSRPGKTASFSLLWSSQLSALLWVPTRGRGWDPEQWLELSWLKGWYSPFCFFPGSLFFSFIFFTPAWIIFSIWVVKGNHFYPNLSCSSQNRS